MGLFKSYPPRPVPRPALWRISMVQCLAWLFGIVVLAWLWPDYAVSFWWGGLVAIGAQAFWIARTLKGFGDPHSKGFLTGATSGLIGKWVIISVGLVLLWRNQPDLSVATTVVSVFLLNTLAALTAPISIARPR